MVKAWGAKAFGLSLMLSAFGLVSCTSPQQEGHKFQTTQLDGNHALIIDEVTGEVWYWIDAPIGVRLRYMGKLRPGASPGEIISQFQLIP